MIVLGVDPGSRKCGLAIVEIVGAPPLDRAIVPPTELLSAARRLIARHAPTAIALGHATESDAAAHLLAELGLPLARVDETGTTLAARARYFAVYPPRGWRRLVPRGMLLPPEPIDDFAAALIAERGLATSATACRAGRPTV